MLLTLSALLLLALPQNEAAPGLARSPAEVRERAGATLAGFLADGKVPGISAGIATGEFQLGLAAGRRTRAADALLQPDDLLCAGSTGKTFVAAVVLQLVQEHRLALDDLAGEYLGQAPWFEHLPNAAELTIENLLDHRSGLPRYEFQPEFTRDLIARPDHVWKPEELLAYVLDHAPAVEAGKGFAYADTNYIVLGMIVEAVTHATLYEEVRRRLLEPLALAHVRPQDGRVIPGLVQGHAGAHDPLGFPELVLDADGRFCTNPQFEWAGGGFVTSGGDLARWARSLWGGQVLAPETLARMVQGLPAPELGRDVAYGLGTIVWKSRHGLAWGHEGFFPGYMSAVRYWPEHRLAIAVQVNTSDFGDLPKPLGRLCDELFGSVVPE